MRTPAKVCICACACVPCAVCGGVCAGVECVRVRVRGQRCVAWRVHIRPSESARPPVRVARPSRSPGGVRGRTVEVEKGGTARRTVAVPLNGYDSFGALRRPRVSG